MKNILLIALFLTATGAWAQNKPTKEETLDFMRRTAEAAIGSEYNSSRTTEITFTGDTYSRKSVMEIGNNKIGGTYDDTYSGIKWENLIASGFALKNCGIGENGICEMWVSFTNKVKFFEGKDLKYAPSGEKTTFTQTVGILIPSEKFESMKKACLRLAELAKEENKDPFQN